LLERLAQRGRLVIVMGAGDVDQLGRSLVRADG
jgi:UDP-N-acetylmuramate-alanine ligase